jgi:hypothetical protein
MLGYRDAGTTVRVIIDDGNANVRVMDFPNAALFLGGQPSSHIAVGMSAGMAWETGLPRSTDWLVVMDGEQSTKAIVQVVKGTSQESNVDEVVGGDPDVLPTGSNSSTTPPMGPFATPQSPPDPRELAAEYAHPSARPGHPLYWADGSREEMSPTGLVTFTGPHGEELKPPQLIPLYPRRDVNMAGIPFSLRPSGDRIAVTGAPGVEQQRVVDPYGVLVGVVTYGADGKPGVLTAGGSSEVRDSNGRRHLFRSTGAESDSMRPVNSLGPASMADWGELIGDIFNFLVPVGDVYKGVTEWEDIGTGEKVTTAIEIVGMIPGAGTVLAKIGGGAVRVLRAVRWGRAAEVASKPIAGASKYELDYPQYVERKTREGKTPRGLEDYVAARQRWDRNLAAGRAWEADIGAAKGFTADNGWATGKLAPTGPARGQRGSRIWDFMHEVDQKAIEAKAGQVNAETFKRQIEFDVQMVKERKWQVTWVLKEELTPGQMAVLEQLKSETGGRFNYEIGLG